MSDFFKESVYQEIGEFGFLYNRNSPWEFREEFLNANT